jgi:hypothetical protein
MKSFYTKSKLIAILTISLFSASVNGQDVEVAPPSKIIQELMLIDNKISFNAEQMDVNSVKVTVIKEVEKKITPKMSIIENGIAFITIDFSKCESGDYLITGKRGDMEITYLVKHIK